MNPRVSRSSALASKATGFPIAKFAAKLAAGYTLDEIPNDITKKTPASFEPSIDYIVVKIPRFAFEKFRNTPRTLGLSMQSVGESMAIGRTFNEALQKGLRSLEIGVSGLETRNTPKEKLAELLRTPTPERIFVVGDAFRAGMTVDQIYECSDIDPWFLREIRKIIELEDRMATQSVRMLELKRNGFSDAQIAKAANAGTTEKDIRDARHADGIRPVYKRVDTCAAEFEASTPYLYSTYETENEAAPTNRRKVMILGSGPNRIGQGIEFDTCCVHASFALREIGFETIMVNCNPETVSTDYDTSDRLYFEPLTLEDVLEIVDLEKPEGVIVQFGGQTPLKLAKALAEAGVPMWGTSVDSIDIAEDRERFGVLVKQHEILVPDHGTAMTEDEALLVAHDIGYPVVVRPSYVLGGRAMAIVYDDALLHEYIGYAMEAAPGHPILIDRFLEDAVEIDVDAISDGHDVVIAGVMQHIEEAGIHSGDSTTVIPPYIITQRDQDRIRRRTIELAKALNVIGLMNVQYAIYHGDLYVLEVNPRASRTVPYLSKATGVPLAKVAAQLMVGRTLAELGFVDDLTVSGVFVKTPVFPFVRFPGVDTLLGPEMKSTGEVMGGADTFGSAFAKAQMAAGQHLPDGGTAFISVNNQDKASVVPIARELARLGFKIVATRGTAAYLRAHGLDVDILYKINEGRPHVGDELLNRRIALVINTPLGRESFFDDRTVRSVAMLQGVPAITTLTGAAAAVSAIGALKAEGLSVKSLQEYHAELAPDVNNRVR
jgi:carbamoyl-phosphate synthase large subunit